MTADAMHAAGWVLEGPVSARRPNVGMAGSATDVRPSRADHPRMSAPTLAGKLVVAISRARCSISPRATASTPSDGVDAYHRYQIEHEDELLAPGPAFALVKKLLRLNRADKQYVEVILLSRNSADTGLARVQLDQALRARHHARRVHQRRADVALRAGVRRAPVPVRRYRATSRRALDDGYAAATIFPSVRRQRTRPTSCASRSTATRCSSPTRPSASTRQAASPRSAQSERELRRAAAVGRAVQGFPRGAASDPGGLSRGREPDPHRARHRAQRAGARARDPHAARLEHPHRRGAVPRRTRQGRVPARVRRRYLLRRPARARRIGGAARGGRARAARHRQ